VRGQIARRTCSEQGKMELWKAQYVARVSKYRNKIAKLNKCPKHMSLLLVLSVSPDLGQQDKKKEPSTNVKLKEQSASCFVFPFSFFLSFFDLFSIFCFFTRQFLSPLLF
jgi:hypothetical protein